MKRFVMMTIAKLLAKVFLLTLIVGIGIGAMGRVNAWDSSRIYSNAFFIVGCLVIIGSASSRLGAGEDWSKFQLLDAESFRDMSSVERANFIVEVSSSVGLLIVGVLTGVILILISWIVAKIF